MTIRRLRPTTQEWPGDEAPEGKRAAYWREHVMGLSRPAMAELLGLTSQTITRYEESDEVPAMYRLACAALTAQFEFDWKTAKIDRDGLTIQTKA